VGHGRGIPLEPTRHGVCALDRARQGRPFGRPASRGCLDGRDIRRATLACLRLQPALPCADRMGGWLGAPGTFRLFACFWIIRRVPDVACPPQPLVWQKPIVSDSPPRSGLASGVVFCLVCPLGHPVLSAPALSETRTEGGYRTCSIARSTCEDYRDMFDYPAEGTPNSFWGCASSGAAGRPRAASRAPQLCGAQTCALPCRGARGRASCSMKPPSNHAGAPPALPDTQASLEDV
jgi:hypothetical protein